MATPPRLVKLECPMCQDTHWEIDHDSRGAHLIGQKELEYPERLYACPGCKHHGAGWSVRDKSPALFLLQPHPVYPMRRSEFEYWTGILKAHFPDHPLVSKIGGEFRPNTQVMLTRFRNLMLNRRYYYGRLRYHIGKRLGWH